MKIDMDAHRKKVDETPHVKGIDSFARYYDGCAFCQERKAQQTGSFFMQNCLQPPIVN